MTPDLARLEALARGGDESALAESFRAYDARLVRMIELRLDASLRRRLDPADVVQETWLEVVRRFDEWRPQPMPLLAWLRFLTSQSLAQAQRRHLGTTMRDAQRDRALGDERPSVSSARAAEEFLASATSPTQAAARSELRARVLTALEELEPIDREIVALRHFEGLSNDEAAVELGIESSAASKRFLRALARLRPLLESLAAQIEGASR
jgi:RNA polymerase sigma-70 factor (ECF subfamily)